MLLFRITAALFQTRFLIFVAPDPSIPKKAEKYLSLTSKKKPELFAADYRLSNIINYSEISDNSNHLSVFNSSSFSINPSSIERSSISFTLRLSFVK